MESLVFRGCVLNVDRGGESLLQETDFYVLSAEVGTNPRREPPSAKSVDVIFDVK